MTLCRETTEVAACFNDGVNPPVSVVRRSTFDHQGAPLVQIVDMAGSPVVGATLLNTTIGACALPDADVETMELCDLQPGGTSVPFIRRKVFTVDALGAVAVVVSDYTLDGATAYVVTGTVGLCPSCPPLPVRGFVGA